MQIDFPLIKPRGLVGQKFDATSSTIISLSANEPVNFGSLLCYLDTENKAFIPKTKEHLLKPLGIALRQYHCEQYAQHTPIAILRQGRVWVEAEDVTLGLDKVYIKLTNNGPIFTGIKEGNHLLANAIFLEAQSKGIVPIEINLLGGN